MDNELLSYVYLLQSGYTHKELKELLIENENIEASALWENTKQGIFPPLTGGREEKIREKLTKINIDNIRNILEKYSVEIITQRDARYPKNLKSIGHAPAFFFLRGNLSGTKPLIGVVGSRKNTHYAERILTKILPDIVDIGIGVVSGGATGVDSLAHEITLKVGGYTIVVLGTGIDVCYPLKNASLFQKIIDSGGALLSHFPLSTGAEQYNFPMRNELVAALSKGILIPEAGLSSGTLITAQLALEHGRDVFAVPGDIDRTTSEGTNMLISTGQAKCIRCSGDILEEYFDVSALGAGMTPLIEASPLFENKHETTIYESIRNGNTTIDELHSVTGLEMVDLLTHISLLEIGGHIRVDQMGKYRVNSERRIVN